MVAPPSITGGISLCMDAANGSGTPGGGGAIGVAAPTEVSAAPGATLPAGVAGPKDVAAALVSAARARRYGSPLAKLGGWGWPFASAVAQSSIINCAVAIQFMTTSESTCASASSASSFITELGVGLGCARHDVARKRMITSIMVVIKLENRMENVSISGKGPGAKNALPI